MKYLASIVLTISFFCTAIAHNGPTRMTSSFSGKESLVVATDGTLLLRLNQHNESHFPSTMTEEVSQIRALQPDGQIKWTFSSQLIGEDLVMHGQMLTTESLVIFSLRERNVHTRRIITDRPGEGGLSQDREFHLVALDLATGEIVWQLTLDSLTPMAPAFDENHEQLYVRIVRDMRENHGDHQGDRRDHGHETILMAINFEGEVIWEYTLDN